MSVSPIYRMLMAAGVRLVPFVNRDPVALRGHRGRIAATEALVRWGQTSRDGERPLVWMHAASVGEGLQGREVLSALRSMRPDIQAVATRFSASAERLAPTMPADLVEYLPYDRPADIGRVLEALQPDLLFFAKLDLWPELSTRASMRGCQVALVAGAVDPGSTRLKWPGRNLAAPGYQSLTAIAANGAADLERLVRLGAHRERIVVTGDPRLDSVLSNVSDLANRSGAFDEASEMVLVAGSTWPGDERVLVGALVQVRERHPEAKLLVAPHTPTEARLSGLESLGLRAGLNSVRWDSSGEIPPAPLVIIERMGVLAELYGRGRIAYVGGGFGTQGVHSVVEPAAWARPVVIGPKDRGLREAEILHRAGALERLPPSGGAQVLGDLWCGWISDQNSLSAAGSSAASAFEAERGAAGRAAAMLEALLPAVR